MSLAVHCAHEGVQVVADISDWLLALQLWKQPARPAWPIALRCVPIQARLHGCNRRLNAATLALLCCNRTLEEGLVIVQVARRLVALAPLWLVAIAPSQHVPVFAPQRIHAPVKVAKGHVIEARAVRTAFALL